MAGNECVARSGEQKKQRGAGFDIESTCRPEREDARVGLSQAGTGRLRRDNRADRTAPRSSARAFRSVNGNAYCEDWAGFAPRREQGEPSMSLTQGRNSNVGCVEI